MLIKWPMSSCLKPPFHHLHTTKWYSIQTYEHEVRVLPLKCYSLNTLPIKWMNNYVRNNYFIIIYIDWSLKAYVFLLDISADISFVWISSYIHYSLILPCWISGGMAASLPIRMFNLTSTRGKNTTIVRKCQRQWKGGISGWFLARIRCNVDHTL